MDLFNQAQKLADTFRDKVQEAANSINDVADGVKSTAAKMTDSGIATVNEFKLSTTAAQQGLDAIQNASQVFDSVKATATGVAGSGMVIANALNDLPKTAEELAL